MKNGLYCFVFLLIISMISCNNTSLDNTKSTHSEIGDGIPYTWMKFEIINNTNQDVAYDMSLIDITFDVSNDCRNDESVDIWLRNFWSFTIKDKDKFESLFEQELTDKTLYKNYYDPTGDDVFEDMSYNPIQDYYNWTLNDIKGNLQAKSSQKYYCWNIIKGTYGVSALYSALAHLAIGKQKFIIPGWSQSLYTYDVTDDAEIHGCLDICEDSYNPKNKTNAEWSQCFKCDCYELTITINGDTSSDIVVTKNCINPWN